MTTFTPECEAFARKIAADTWDFLDTLPGGKVRQIDRHPEGRDAWIETNWPYYACGLVEHRIHFNIPLDLPYEKVS